MLYGRDTEVSEIDQLLAGVRAGHSGSVVIRGEAGAGKSALLDYAASTAEDMRLLRGGGVESESELPFAGVHLLVHPFLDRLDALPPVQAGALRGALGLDDTVATDRFLIGLAVLSLLADIAEDGPLLCLVDDVQWIDQASTDALLFAARRLGAEPVALVFAVRDGDATPDTPGPGELRLRSLDDTAARELLADHAADLIPQVRDRIIKEACGNPLALIELAAALTPDQRAGLLTLPAFGAGVLPASGWVRRNFDGRIQKLPEPARTLLLVAAADDTGDPAVVLEAAGRLGVSLADLESAEDQKLLRITDGRLAFRHPLIRTAVYEGARLTRRLAVHRALAEVLSDGEHAARRAWHLAAATDGPDEKVAAALEHSAEQARARGGHSAVATAYERAAQLSRDPERRAQRLSAAAHAAGEAGQPRRATTLADQAASHLTDPLTLAELARIRATMALEQGRPKAAHDTLVMAAHPIAGQAPGMTASMMFEAMSAAWIAGDDVRAASTAERLSELGLPETLEARPLVRGADGLAHMFMRRPDKGIPALRELAAVMRARGRSLALWQRASIGTFDCLTGDFQTSHDSAVALVQECREQGAIGVLPRALLWLAHSQLFLGHHRDTLASTLEGLRIAQETSQAQWVGLLKALLVYLAAVEGDEERCQTIAEEVIATGETLNAARCSCALSLLDLGFGRYEAALRRLEDVGSGPAWHTMALFSLPDRVEAAARLGEYERAYEPVPRFEAWAEHTGQPWAAAIALRRRALLASDEEAEQHYAEAVRQHLKGGHPFERGRTELLYGEWLRRSRRRTDARHQLRSALDIFQRLGARPWADRARNELRATGESHLTDDDGPDLADRLTPQELQVTRLAAAGMSNRDIGAQLFISPRTVGYHLYKAYPKLGIASRRELVHLQLDNRPQDD